MQALILHNHFPLGCLAGVCTSYPVDTALGHLQHYRFGFFYAVTVYLRRSLFELHAQSIRSQWEHASLPVLRIRIRDPVPFWPLNPGPGMGKNQDLYPGSASGMSNPDHFSESAETIFWVKIRVNSLMRIRDLRWKNSDPGWNKFGSGINIADPQYCSPISVFLTLICCSVSTWTIFISQKRLQIDDFYSSSLTKSYHYQINRFRHLYGTQEFR
jgi:hypothetical protein